jgi:serine/threonine protein kinase
MNVQSNEHMKLIKSEVDVWKTLSQKNSPNIVKFHEAHMDRENNCALILSELCSGGTLFDLLEKYNGKMTEPQIVYILLEISLGLEIMHEMGI